MAKNRKINVQGVGIILYKTDNSDYISLTDMTKAFREGSSLIGKWITNKNTLEYIGIWEKINNPDFNYPEFGVIEREAGSNRFIMSVGQWIERTKAIGLEVKTGRYGGTFAYKDIAFHFATPDRRSRELLESLFQFEDDYLKEHRSDFVFGLYRLKTHET